MKEIDVSFKNMGETVRGVLHLPSKRTDKAIIICHGFTGYKREPQIVNCCRALANRGYAALRFDFRGSGNSDNLFRNMSLSGEASDLEKAIAFMKSKGYRRIGLVGHSVGGSVVILADKKDVQAVVLWAPTISLKEIFTRLYGKDRIHEIETKGWSPMSWDGKAIEFVVGKHFWNEVKTKYVNLVDNLVAINLPKTIIAGTKDFDWKEESGEIIGKINKTKINMQWIKNSDHTFSKGEYEKQVIDLTSKFFKRWLK